AELFAREGNLRDALGTADATLSIARDSGDCLLETLGAVCKADVLRQMGSRRIAVQMLCDISLQLLQRPPDVFAQYERVLACSLAEAGELDAGRGHFERSRRIYEGLQTVPGLMELSRSWSLAKDSVSASDQTADRNPLKQPGDVQQVLQSTVAVMLL